MYIAMYLHKRAVPYTATWLSEPVLLMDVLRLLGDPSLVEPGMLSPN